MFCMDRAMADAADEFFFACRAARRATSIRLSVEGARPVEVTRAVACHLCCGVCVCACWGGGELIGALREWRAGERQRDASRARGVRASLLTGGF